MRWYDAKREVLNSQEKLRVSQPGAVVQRKNIEASGCIDETGTVRVGRDSRCQAAVQPESRQDGETSIVNNRSHADCRSPLVPGDPERVVLRHHATGIFATRGRRGKQRTDGGRSSDEFLDWLPGRFLLSAGSTRR